ncbi:hypothetical protein V8E55_003815 [Tylopilus felleus]
MFYRSPLAQSETGCDFHQTCCREYRHHRCQKSPPERVHDRTVIAELVPSLHKVADNALREIAHLHSQIDYSLHLILSPRDCKLATPLEWNDDEYLLIYAPRDEQELGIVERILIASITYVTGEREIGPVLIPLCGREAVNMDRARNVRVLIWLSEPATVSKCAIRMTDSC